MRLALPNLLATRKGRLTAFFLLYVTEGIPLGFTATAIAALIGLPLIRTCELLRQAGLDPLGARASRESPAR